MTSRSLLAIALLLVAAPGWADESAGGGHTTSHWKPILELHLPDQEEIREAVAFYDETSPLRQASLLQPTPLLEPRIELAPAPPARASTLTSRLFGDGTVDRSILRGAKKSNATFAADVVRGYESVPLTTTDIGSLLKKSTSALSTQVQSRTPIVNDPRVRSSRIGSLAAAGSYWVPARTDLDSVISKIDSRLIEDVIVVPGPYSSVYGPGFHFVDFQLTQSPRSSGGIPWQGRSGLDHSSNGNRWLATQSVSYARSNWGLMASYAHRYGNNYRDGDGLKVASEYESRELTIATGRDLGDQRSVEFSLLRLDQTDVAFPGYVFDIDNLGTNGYEVAYLDEQPSISDRLETEVWYNRTRFNGNAQNPSKRQQFPFLDRLNYVGFTDVDSLSTGYRQAWTWADNRLYQVTVGHDLRFIKQELNEIASGNAFVVPLPFVDRNSPIPRSFSVNPGVFLEYNEEVFEDWIFRSGARLDFVQTDIVADPATLQEVGLEFIPATYEEIVGTSLKQTDRLLGSLYASVDRRIGDSLTSGVSVGYAERVPTLTELYAAQPFLLMLQNGLNNVTGDPTLKREKMLQADFRMDFEGERVRWGLRGFHSWAFDYVTFENTEVLGPTIQLPEQVSLRYVNTDLATFVGGEVYLELFPGRHVSPFLTLRGIDGRDRSRNGNFATTNGSAGNPSQKVAGLDRGSFSNVPGAASEPLPGISPFEMNVGVTLTEPVAAPVWNLVFSARIVDNQDRVATSLLESTTPGFTTLDLRGTYQPSRLGGILLVAGIENLTDRTYREHLDFRSFSGIPVRQPGANFYVGTDWAY